MNSKNKLQSNSRAVPWLPQLSHTLLERLQRFLDTITSNGRRPRSPKSHMTHLIRNRAKMWMSPAPALHLHWGSQLRLCETIIRGLWAWNASHLNLSSETVTPITNIFQHKKSLFKSMVCDYICPGTQECHLNSCWTNEKNHRSEFKTKWRICTRAWWTYRNTVQKNQVISKEMR